jgi:hypothetical protein
MFDGNSNQEDGFCDPKPRHQCYCTYNTVLHKPSLIEKKLGRDLLQVLDLEVLCCFQEITHLVKYEGKYSSYSL